MTDKLDLDKIAKEEYEIQLYGFSIKQFRSESKIRKLANLNVKLLFFFV